MTSAPLLQTRQLGLGYGRTLVVSGLDMSLKAGQLVAVVGHNGAGKTSLVRTLLGLIPPAAGELTWPQTGSKPPIAYLGQRSELDRSVPMKCRDLVASGGWDLRKIFGFGQTRADLAEATDAALEQVGLSKQAHLQLHQLSGGQIQRALFARAIVQDAPFIILDEPFAGVDQQTETKLQALVQEWAAQGRAVLLVSHDLSSVLSIADKALLLGNGTASFGAPQAVLSQENLIAHSYVSAAQVQWLQSAFSNKGAAHA